MFHIHLGGGGEVLRYHTSMYRYMYVDTIRTEYSTLAHLLLHPTIKPELHIHSPLCM